MHFRKRTLSRLLAVQAIYHLLFSEQNLMIGEELPLPDWMLWATDTLEVLKKDFDLKSTSYDEALYLDLATGVQAHEDALKALVEKNLTSGRSLDRLELMLQALLLSAAFEITHHLETPLPVLIEEYLALTDAFFSQQESKLVHGVLFGLSHAR